MSSSRITYTPRNDTSAEVEVAALASIYAYIVNSRQGKEKVAGSNGGDNDTKQERR